MNFKDMINEIARKQFGGNVGYRPMDFKKQEIVLWNIKNS